MTKSLRIDRLLSIKLGKTLGKLSREKSGLRIPILMYHSISDAPEEVRHPYFKTNTSPRVFAEHMRILKEDHYAVLRLDEACSLLENGGAPGEKVAVITFDDGFADFRTAAFPILRENGFGAAVFLPTGFISDGECCFKGKRCLNWAEIRELADSGIEFGSHTVSHPNLCGLDWRRVDAEVGESRRRIEDNIGKSVVSFSYPYAFPEGNGGFIELFKHSLVESGYINGVTTKVGTARRGDDRLFLRRIPVNSEDDPVFFRAKLEGAYDWVRGVQCAFKKLKRTSDS